MILHLFIIFPQKKKKKKVGVNDVKDSVKETLDGGVRYGYVQRVNKKYFMAPLELNEIVEDSKDLDTAKGDTAKKLEESFARRRRGRTRGRGRRRRLGVRRRRR